MSTYYSTKVRRIEPNPPAIFVGALSVGLALLLSACAIPPSQPRPVVWQTRYEYVVPSEWNQGKAGCKEVGIYSFRRWFGADGFNGNLRWLKNRHEYAELWLSPVKESSAQNEEDMVFVGIAIGLRVPSGLTVQFSSRDFLTTNLNDGVQYSYSAERGSALIKSKKRQGIVDDSYDKVEVDFLERLVGHTYRLPWVLRWSDSERSFNSSSFIVTFLDFRSADFEILVPDFFVNDTRYALPPIRWTAAFGPKESSFFGKVCPDNTVE